MVQINFAQKEIQCKIVYYGPGMSGKTTNLELVHAKAPEDYRGDLTSIATTGERTLYFDYMPLDLGQIAGISTKFQLYTVPGQIYYKSTRRLVLQGVDGIVFVADSSAAKLRENKESLADLEDNLREMGKALTDVPIVMQYNKRDVPDAMPIEDLDKELNPHDFPTMEATATRGDGVFPTLKHLAGLVLEAVNKGGLATARSRTSRMGGKARQPAVATVGAGVSATARAASESSPPSTRPSPSVQARAAPPANKPPPFRDVHAVGSTRTGTDDPVQAVVPAARPAYSARSMKERVVSVGEFNSGRSSKLLLMVTLGLLIAGAVAFVVTQF